MAKIMLAWELGAGLGHLGRLAPIAKHLSASGHQLDLATRVLRPVELLFGDSVQRVFQAPHRVTTRSEGISPTLSFAHILHNIGFESEDGLRSLVRAWLALYELTGTEFMIADHSPTAVLAAHIAGIPCITVGNGFEHPEPGQALPNLWIDLNKEQCADVEKSEHEVLERTNAVLKHFGNLPMDFASDIYAVPKSSMLLTLPVLDHLGAREHRSYYGLIDAQAGTQPRWPRNKGPRLYAYLKPGPRMRELFAGLNAMKLNTLVYYNNLAPDLVNEARSNYVRFTSHLLDLKLVAEQADAALLNATHSTLGHLLAGGVPCAMAPLHPEQNMLAMRVFEQGVGVVVNNNEDKNMLAGVQAILNNRKFRDSARRYAKACANDDQTTLTLKFFADIDATIATWT